MDDFSPKIVAVRLEFVRGLRCLREKKIQEACAYMARVALRADELDKLYFLYQAYYGYICVLLGDAISIRLCRNASYFEQRLVEVHYIQALAELQLQNRKEAVNALRRGLTLDHRNVLLLYLREKIGFRRTPIIRCFPREHWLNHLLGRCVSAVTHYAKWH